VLALAAATAAATLTADGKPLTRKTLAAALRRDGHALSNATASRLLTTVRTPGARAQRRLLKLTHLGVLARFRPQKWDGGSHPYHYVLDQLGTEVVAAQRGDDPPRRGQAKRRRDHLTSRASLPHLLGTNQFFIDLAAHERTHPGTRLRRWWPAARFHEQGAFYRRNADPNLMLIRSPPRPDGHGIWAEPGDAVPFLLEYDTGSERLEILTDKVAGYSRLAAMTDWRWPVLFWLPSTRRELNLHHRLAADGPPRALIATAAADHASLTGQTPADAVWWLHGLEGERLRLAHLPFIDPEEET